MRAYVISRPAMYLQYFGFTEAPFSIAPDPRFLYLSQRHQEALAHLLFGVTGDGGFVLLTGEVGSGKTTICRCLLEQTPENCEVAYIFNPKLTVVELLSTICNEIGICYPPGNTSVKVFVDFINSYLLRAHAKGQRAVLIIDEAQNLSADVLEQMRLLTNLETTERKLLQIILIGQPELATMLARRELRQLSQRIVARYHLDPLSRSEVRAYVRHRLEVSGGKSHLIPEALTGRLYRLSGGVPRLINVICDRALLGAYVQGKDRVDRPTLDQAAREVLDASQLRRGRWPVLALAGAALLALAMAWGVNRPQPAASPADALPKPIARQALAPEVTVRLPAELPAPDASLVPAEQEKSAYEILFKAWGIPFLPAADACAQAEGKGLRCFRGQGTVDELRRLNRPAVVVMRSAAGAEFAAALTQLSADEARFVVGGQERATTPAALATQWTGRYLLLWQPPPGAPERIRPGTRGAPVQWLARQLAVAQGKPADSAVGRDVFDQAMVRELKEFQRQVGLPADGVAGVRTQMFLAGVSPREVSAAGAGKEPRQPLNLRMASELGDPVRPAAGEGR